MDQSAASLLSATPRPKMCQKSSRFPSPSFLEKKEFPREAFSHSWHLRRRCSQSKAALFCLFLCCCWCNNVSDGGQEAASGTVSVSTSAEATQSFTKMSRSSTVGFLPEGRKVFSPLFRTSYEEKGRALMWVDTGDLCRPAASAS